MARISRGSRLAQRTRQENMGESADHYPCLPKMRKELRDLLCQPKGREEAKVLLLRMPTSRSVQDVFHRSSNLWFLRHTVYGESSSEDGLLFHCLFKPKACRRRQPTT